MDTELSAQFLVVFVVMIFAAVPTDCAIWRIGGAVAFNPTFPARKINLCRAHILNSPRGQRRTSTRTESAGRSGWLPTPVLQDPSSTPTARRLRKVSRGIHRPSSLLC
jgi:hypothetical protein